MHPRARDLTGLSFGYLTAEVYAGSDGKNSLWTCRCICGRTVEMAASEITKQKKRGIWASCGCRRRQSIGQRNTAHGKTQHPLFHVWRSMLTRCNLPTAQAYRRYGGRGIVVCERWQESFEAFWEDMYSTYHEGLVLDRRDNEGDYTPENCHWVTYKQSARNTSSNRVIQTPWGEMTVSEAAEKSGVKKTTLTYRLDHGVPESRLFDTPDVRNRFMTS